MNGFGAFFSVAKASVFVLGGRRGIAKFCEIYELFRLWSIYIVYIYNMFKYIYIRIRTFGRVAKSRGTTSTILIFWGIFESLSSLGSPFFWGQAGGKDSPSISKYHLDECHRQLTVNPLIWMNDFVANVGITNIPCYFNLFQYSMIKAWCQSQKKWKAYIV